MMSHCFYDWIKVTQVHNCELPVVTDIVINTVECATGEIISTKQPYFMHEGSYSSTVKIQVRGNEITFDGNISRLGRIDNLYGFDSIDKAMYAINSILAVYGLPPFTKTTKVTLSQTSDGKHALMADGAVFKRLDITSNISVGKGNINAYLKSLSTQKCGHYAAHLYEKTVDWKAAKKGNTRLVYRKVYDKAHDLKIHLKTKIKRSFGEDSKDYKYLIDLINYCEEQGIVRFEQELKAEFLQRHGLSYWGLMKEADIMKLQADFLKLDEQLKVTAIDYESISEALVRVGACPSIRSANITAMHAMDWKAGRLFNGSVRGYERHRAKLRKIGLDIAIPYKKDRHGLTIVKREEVVVVNKNPVLPDWYRMPNHLRLVA